MQGLSTRWNENVCWLPVCIRSIHNGRDLYIGWAHSSLPIPFCRSPTWKEWNKSSVANKLYWGVCVCAILIIILILNAVNSPFRRSVCESRTTTDKIQQKILPLLLCNGIYGEQFQHRLFFRFHSAQIPIYDFNHHSVMCKEVNGWPFGLHRFGREMNMSNHRIQQYILDSLMNDARTLHACGT